MRWKVRLVLFAFGSCGLAAQAQQAARLIAEGDSLLAIDRPQKAADKFSAAIEASPTADSYAARARAWFYMERMDRFLLDVDKALKLDSLHLEANQQRALYALRGEDYGRAALFSSRALDHGAKGTARAQLLVLRGTARAELKQTPLAIADLTEGLGDNTDDHVAMKVLARAHDANNDHAASLAVLEKLCAVEPEDIGNWTNRGYELAMLNRYDEALTMYGEALAMDKDEPTALSDRAHTYLKLGRDAEAMTDVERSLRSYPGNAFALSTRAQLLLKKGDKDKACADLSLAHIIGGVPEVEKLIEENCAGR